MKMTRTTLWSWGIRAVTFAVVLAGASAYAQSSVWPAPPDPRMVVVPVRSVNEVAIDIVNATTTRQFVLNRNVLAVNRVNEIASAIEAREASIKDIDRRTDVAKNGGRDAEVASLKIEADANKNAIDLLKRLKDLRKAEIDVARVEEEHADITIRVFEMESELQGKRAEYNWLSVGSVDHLTQNTAHQVLGELEVGLLKLQQEMANATQKVASKQSDVVGRRMKLHQAQLDLGMSQR